MSNKSWTVKLQRSSNDTKLGPTVMNVTVQAPTSMAAKNMGESMARGYRAMRADPQR